MTATTYAFDVLSSLDGFGATSGNWGGYWGKQGPELLDHRLALYGAGSNSKTSRVPRPESFGVLDP